MVPMQERIKGTMWHQNIWHPIATALTGHHAAVVQIERMQMHQIGTWNLGAQRTGQIRRVPPPTRKGCGECTNGYTVQLRGIPLCRCRVISAVRGQDGNIVPQTGHGTCHLEASLGRSPVLPSQRGDHMEYFSCCGMIRQSPSFAGDPSSLPTRRFRNAQGRRNSSLCSPAFASHQASQHARSGEPRSKLHMASTRPTGLRAASGVSNTPRNRMEDRRERDCTCATYARHYGATISRYDSELALAEAAAPSVHLRFAALGGEAREPTHGVLAFLSFLIPSLVWIEFQLIGRIFAPELILTALLPFLLWTRGGILRNRLPVTFLLLALFWLVAQITTDLVRDSAFVDFSRGWARVAFTMVNFCSLYLLLYGHPQRMVLFAFGWAAGEVMRSVLGPELYLDYTLMWKFYMGVPVTLAGVLLCQHRLLRRIWFAPSLALLLLGVYSMSLGSRALAGVALLACFYVFAQQLAQKRRKRPARRSVISTLVVSVTIFISIAGSLAIYQISASSGYLGEQARQIYETQGAGNFGILLGGRPEIYGSAQAVIDSPILGHGSWARDREYAMSVLDLDRFGYRLWVDEEQDLIPAHSHLMGAWVQAGIMGMAFWSWVLILVCRVLLHIRHVHEPFLPMVAFIGFLILWDIAFSPFGAERRFLTPFYLVVFMFAWDLISRALVAGRTVPRRPPLSPTIHRLQREAARRSTGTETRLLRL